jgi:mannose-6-phosphate isomerase-like protein (cupin superfamily)
VAEERMPPGTAETWHVHVRATQTFYVLAGVPVLDAGGVCRTVAACQAATVPAGVPHRVVNEETREATFFAIAGPSTRGDRADMPGPDGGH